MSNPHVLVVDDEADIRALIKDILSDENFGVTVAANAEEAKARISSDSFDVGIFDVNMPGQNGIDLTRDVKGMPGGKEMKIIILTTESGDDLKKAGREAGAVGWLTKPFEENDLLELIKRL